MPNGNPRRTTAFISYSWDSDSHRAWVLKFAEDLENSGVDTILDRWNLRPASDIAQFESRIVSSDYAMLVCTPRYAEKANGLVGGVGSEFRVLTGQLAMGGMAWSRVVPILRAGQPANSIPKFLGASLAIDFRQDGDYETSLRQLLGYMKAQPSTERVVNESINKWILVAGTGDADKLPPRVEEASRLLGRALAEARYGLITGGWPGVDRVVADAFAGVVLTDGRPLEDHLFQVVAEGSHPAFPGGDYIIVPRGDAEWSECIEKADAAVIIEGKGGAYRSGRDAKLAG